MYSTLSRAIGLTQNPTDIEQFFEMEKKKYISIFHP